MAKKVLFGFVVIRHAVDEGGDEEAEHTEIRECAGGAQEFVAIHGETPKWDTSYFTTEYLWNRRPMLNTTIWLM
jgi:hypothetical protein